MKTPFTTEQFFHVIEQYNSAIFPFQFILIILGIIAVVFLHTNKEKYNNLISGFLAFLWLWIGIAYHIVFFTDINKAAYGFGAISILQGIFFLIELRKGKLVYSFTKNSRSYLGYFFIVFGLIIYPVISFLMGENFSETISLGLPCPTTIMTFGFLMLTSNKLSKYLLIIPTVWAIIGTGAAINFGVTQDYVMLVSAIVANIYLLPRKKE
jgi:hypothetical protein